jgi:hypothetical protein
MLERFKKEKTVGHKQKSPQTQLLLQTIERSYSVKMKGNV